MDAAPCVSVCINQLANALRGFERRPKKYEATFSGQRFETKATCASSVADLSQNSVEGAKEGGRARVGNGIIGEM